MVVVASIVFVAIVVFLILFDRKVTAKNIEEAHRKIDEATDKLYTESVKEMEQQNYATAMIMFMAIKNSNGWKDSKERLDICMGHVEKMQEMYKKHLEENDNAD